MLRKHTAIKHTCSKEPANHEATTVSHEVHTPSSTGGLSTIAGTSSGDSSSLRSVSGSTRKPLSPLTEFPTLPNIPPTPKSSKPKKCGVHVLTSAAAIGMTEENRGT